MLNKGRESWAYTFLKKSPDSTASGAVEVNVGLDATEEDWSEGAAIVGMTDWEIMMSTHQSKTAQAIRTNLSQERASRAACYYRGRRGRAGCSRWRTA